MGRARRIRIGRAQRCRPRPLHRLEPGHQAPQAALRRQQPALLHPAWCAPEEPRLRRPVAHHETIERRHGLAPWRPGDLGRDLHRSRPPPRHLLQGRQLLAHRRDAGLRPAQRLVGSSRRGEAVLGVPTASPGHLGAGCALRPSSLASCVGQREDGRGRLEPSRDRRRRRPLPEALRGRRPPKGPGHPPRARLDPPRVCGSDARRRPQPNRDRRVGEEPRHRAARSPPRPAFAIDRTAGRPLALHHPARAVGGRARPARRGRPRGRCPPARCQAGEDRGADRCVGGDPHRRGHR